MDDQISRRAAIDVLHMDTSIIPYEKAREYANATILEIRNRLEKLPSAQPEIVRCKNCVNWIPGHITEHDDFIPPKCGKYQQMVGHSSDDYCSFAVRRTDEEVD